MFMIILLVYIIFYYYKFVEIMYESKFIKPQPHGINSSKRIKNNPRTVHIKQNKILKIENMKTRL